MIPVSSQWDHYNLPVYIYLFIYLSILYTHIYIYIYTKYIYIEIIVYTIHEKSDYATVMHYSQASVMLWYSAFFVI